MMERPWFVKTWAEPSGQRGSALRAVLGALACLIAVFLALQSFWIFTAAPAVQAGPRLVDIPPHQGLTGVAGRLDEAGVIRSPLLAKISRIRVGPYQVGAQLEQIGSQIGRASCRERVCSTV